MRCNNFKELIPAYLAGELNEIKCEKVRKHMERCPVCSEELAREQALSSLLDEGDINFPEIDVSSEVMSKVSSYAGTKRSRSRPFSLIQDIVAAAAAAIIVFTSAYALTENVSFNQYDTAIGSISKGIGGLTAYYVDTSSSTVTNVFDSIEKAEIFSKGDKLK